MTLGDVLASATRDDRGLTVAVPAGWMQGRTVYGGLSSALALEAARRTLPGLPPLRTAQVAFFGPLTGTLHARVEELRRGRSAAFVQVDVAGGSGPGMRAVFVFRDARPSAIDHLDRPAPEAPAPEDAVPAFKAAAPAFAGRFDHRETGTDDGAAAFTRWVRLKDRDAVAPDVALLCVGDALPPAALALAPQAGPVSTMAWTVDLLDPEPRTRDGWWLLRSAADAARDGTCSQSMTIWNADGLPVAAGRQSVAVFG